MQGLELIVQIPDPFRELITAMSDIDEMNNVSTKAEATVALLKEIHGNYKQNYVMRTICKRRVTCIQWHHTNSMNNTQS